MDSAKEGGECGEKSTCRAWDPGTRQLSELWVDPCGERAGVADGGLGERYQRHKNSWNLEAPPLSNMCDPNQKRGIFTKDQVRGTMTSF